ncbi:MAG: MBL fold metallo-hydrolase [Desulfuromonadales bacterium]|nr:MBL fold metallo-hydrolase [Desulfuromonadales bacterium]
MAEEIAADLFRIEIPLPATPLRSLNSYVVRGQDRNLIIDTGLNHPDCRRALRSGLRQLGIDLWQTDFFITHLHADHFSQISSFAKPGVSRIYFNRPEAELIEGDLGIGAMLRYAILSGFPAEELRNGLSFHPGIRFGGQWKPDLRLMAEGDLLAVGGYEFRCVETPGHTKGHICLYEPRKRLLVAGDHLFIDISPNIQLWSDTENALGDYLASLDKIAGLEIDLVLPGHRRLFGNHRQRIAELKEHHRQRAEEVLTILAAGGQDAYQVAARMSWDIRFSSWERLHVAQRWFATGEAIAHLKYVQEQGLVRREIVDGRIFFRLS